MNNYIYYSDMMKEDKDTFLNFIQKMLQHYPEYLQFVSTIEELDYKGVHLKFYELDGDGYDDYNVHKWMVEFVPQEETGVDLSFRGYTVETTHRLYDNEQQRFLIEGNFTVVNNYCMSNTWLIEECERLTDEEAQARFVWKNIKQDKFKQWASELTNMNLSFYPDNQRGDTIE